MKKILFYTDSVTGLNGQLVLMSYLKMRGLDSFEPFFCFSSGLDIEGTLKKNGVTKDDYSFEALNTEQSGIAQRIRNKFYMFEKNSIVAPLAIQAHVKETQYKRKELNRLFDRISPDYFFPYTDRRGGDEEILLFIAKERGIPVILPSYCRVVFSSFFDNPKNGVWFEKGQTIPSIYKKAKKINPDWTVEYGEKEYFFSEATTLLADFKCGISNLRPWMVGGTQPDMVCYYSVDAYKEAVEHIGEETLKGHLAYVGRIEDEFVTLYAKRKKEVLEKLKTKYGLKGNKIIVVSSNPAENSGVCDEDTSFYVHKKIVESLAKEPDSEVLISLHPKMNQKKYAALDDFADNITIVSEPLREILGVADYFVFASWSSLDSWAKLLYIPYLLVPFEFWDSEKSAEIEDFFVDWKSKLKHEREDESVSKLNFVDLFLRYDKGEDISEILIEQYNSIMEG